MQIIRFGRSKSLEMRPGKETSKSIVVSADMSPDSTRWLVIASIGDFLEGGWQQIPALPKTKTCMSRH